MATITRRSSGFQAEVRRKGFASVSAMFDSRKEAEAWARGIESEIDRGVHVSRKEAENTTLLEALDRYELEVTSIKKGAPRERYRIDHWRKQALAARFLASIRSTDVAHYRDHRLTQVGSVAQWISANKCLKSSASSVPTITAGIRRALIGSFARYGRRVKKHDRQP